MMTFLCTQFIDLEIIDPLFILMIYFFVILYVEESGRDTTHLWLTYTNYLCFYYLYYVLLIGNFSGELFIATVNKASNFVMNVVTFLYTNKNYIISSVSLQ